jgi:hypothetical protein
MEERGFILFFMVGFLGVAFSLSLEGRGPG